MTVASAEFIALAHQHADELGFPAARLVEVPHPIGGTPPEKLREWARSAVDALLQRLA